MLGSFAPQPVVGEGTSTFKEIKNQNVTLYRWTVPTYIHPFFRYLLSSINRPNGSILLCYVYTFNTLLQNNLPNIKLHSLPRYVDIYIYIYIYISFSSFQKYPSPLTKNERTPAVTLHENSHTHTHTIFFFFLEKIKCNIENKQKKHVLQWGLGDRVPLLPLQRGEQENPFLSFF